MMLKCPQGHGYTLKEKCPVCGEPTMTVHPARYSPDDKYARYRSPQAYVKSE